jgi:arylsulfatase A-like enzyme
VRTRNAKLIKYPGNDEWTELIDLAKDPYETRNLARDPAHASLLAELDAEMQRLSKELGYRTPPQAPKTTFNPKDPR